MPNPSDPDNGWKFAQCFGDKGEVEQISEADIISAVEFDETGDYLATGDKGGRVVLFERNEGKKGCEYKFYTEFQSHEPEFDYLKSLEIEEKINKIRWCKKQNSAKFLLSTNDKTIKLWKVFEKNIKEVTEFNMPEGRDSISGRKLIGKDLKLPKITTHDTMVAAIPRKIYQNAHAYHINSISVNSDGETFLSADDLRINLWNLNIADQSFNIVDIKPVSLEELTEVITAVEFHPKHCNIFSYSTSKGTIKLADMRMSALCDQHAQIFEMEESSSPKTFFSEIILSIADLKFSHDGRFILSRDYLTLKLWDLNMASRPVKTFAIHDQIKPKLCDLYENDGIFDKFECCFSGDGQSALTGSYSNFFEVFDMKTGREVLLQADKSAFKSKKSLGKTGKAAASIGKKLGVGLMSANGSGPGASSRKEDFMNINTMDFNKKILHASWHPKENTVALAATNNLFVFQQVQNSSSSH